MSEITARRIAGLATRAFDDDAYGKVYDKASGAMKDVIPRGSFDITADEKTGQRWFWFRCPGPCGSITAIALRPVVGVGINQSWEFDGNEDAPTLKPSINHGGCWHGWLTNGIFKE